MLTWLRTRAWPIARETIARFNRNDAATLAASTSYYAALSFFPLLLVTISGLGVFLELYTTEHDAQSQVREVLSANTTPAQAEQILDVLLQVRSRATVQGPVGLVVLLLGAIGIFSQLTATFARIWHESAPQPHGILGAIKNALIYRLKAFLVLVGLGLLIVVVFWTTIVLAGVRQFAGDWADSPLAWRRVQVAMVVLLNALAFCLLYKIVPRARVRWRDAARGGLAVAVVWESGRQLLAYVIVRGNYTAYGVVGSFIAMMLWVYYASALLYLGAQFVEVLGNLPADAKGSATGAR